jgi:hypothetical protein
VLPLVAAIPVAHQELDKPGVGVALLLAALRTYVLGQPQEHREGEQF